MIDKPRNTGVRKHQLSAVLLLLTAISLSGCAGLDGGNKPVLDQVLNTPQGVTGDRQSAIGAREHPKIVAANGGVYTNKKIDAMLRATAAALVRHIDDQDKKYTITVLNSPTINAFALPGRYVYITRGLLALASDKAEIAAVLAHEMAHIMANHGVERRKQIETVKLADRVVLDVLSNDQASKIALATNKIKLAKFSRNQELQADAAGIKLLGKAGYDPFAAARFLQSMNNYVSYQSLLSNNVDEDDFLASHPSTPKRIDLAKRNAKKYGEPGSGISVRDEYLTTIDGILYGDSPSEGYVRGNRFSHAGLGITFAVPNGFEIENKADAVIASGPDQVAIRFDGVNQPRSISLVKYLKSGWVNGLDNESVTSLTINGLKAVNGQAIADDWLFEVTLIRLDGQIYRFILAAPRTTTNLAQLNKKITRSFRKLTRAEKIRLRPLKLEIVKVSGGATIASLAGRMQGIARRVDLFRLLNNIESGQRLKTGDLVKIIVSN